MWMSRKVDGIKSREARASQQLVSCRAASESLSEPQTTRKTGKSSLKPQSPSSVQTVGPPA